VEEFKWNLLKSKRLKKTRGMSFEEIVKARLVKIKENSARPGQRLMLYEVKGYIWVVPCLLMENKLFLKTLYPSRKYTKMFRKGEL